MGELRYKALFDELTRCPVLISLTWFFSPDGLLAGVFLQAGWDFLHGAPEGGRGGTRPADRHAHRRQQRVDKGNADLEHTPGLVLQWQWPHFFMILKN